MVAGACELVAVSEVTDTEPLNEPDEPDELGKLDGAPVGVNTTITPGDVPLGS